MKQTYFEYIILRRTEDDVEVVQELDYIVAKDEASVRLQAAKEIPKELEGKLEEVEILVRPFCLNGGTLTGLTLSSDCYTFGQ